MTQVYFVTNLRRIIFVGLGLTLSACNTLPGSGPTAISVLESAHTTYSNNSEFQYELVDASMELISNTSLVGAEGFTHKMTAVKHLSVGRTATAGDILVLNIWEAEGGGLFKGTGPGEAKFELTVSNSGKIHVPYAGALTVAGQSPQSIKKQLEDRFDGTAIDPEISVEIKESNFDRVSVLGAVGSPGFVKIPAKGIRLLDLLAMVGGARHSEWEIEIAVTRSGRTEQVGLDTILSNPKNNIMIFKNDTINIRYAPRKFAVYGAVNKNGFISVDTAMPKLSEVLAQAGGLLDRRAARDAVFVYRPAPNLGVNGINMPVIYRFKLSEPDAFFLLDAFELRASDIIYVSNSKSTEISKFMSSFVSPTLGTARSISTFAE